MIFLLILAGFLAWGVIAALIETRRDGHGPIPTDWTRVGARGGEHDAEMTLLHR